MSVRVYMIKLMDDKIWLDGKRKIACGTSCLLIGTITNLKNYSNRQPEMILHWNHECVSDVLEVGCFCTFFISRTANITVDLHVDFSYLMLSFWVSRVQGIEFFSIWYCYSILCKEHTLNILI